MAYKELKELEARAALCAEATLPGEQLRSLVATALCGHLSSNKLQTELRAANNAISAMADPENQPHQFQGMECADIIASFLRRHHPDCIANGCMMVQGNHAPCHDECELFQGRPQDERKE